MKDNQWDKNKKTWKTVWMQGVMGSVVGGLVLFPPQLDDALNPTQIRIRIKEMFFLLLLLTHSWESQRDTSGVRAGFRCLFPVLERR